MAAVTKDGRRPPAPARPFAFRNVRPAPLASPVFPPDRSEAGRPGNEKFTFFWKGVFSQWHPSRFEIDGVVYTHAEQWMMAEKARLFGDAAALGRVMGAVTPKDQKAAGRSVQPFDEAVWWQNADRIVLEGTAAKFRQNPKMMEMLLATEGTTLVEASPYDRIWGIGLAAADPRALDRATWKGQNRLGKCLTAFRDAELRLEAETTLLRQVTLDGCGPAPQPRSSTPE